MEPEVILFVIIVAIGYAVKRWVFEIKRMRRRNYYRDKYLKSNDWKRKRYVVLKRDNWRCVYCGAPANQVHHTRYAKRRIGKEPIKWLVSVCNGCHESLHGKKNRFLL